MSKPMKLSIASLLVGIGLLSVTFAAGPKISDPAKVDKDYALQGEYSGNFKD